jgi:hypothetical protein
MLALRQLLSYISASLHASIESHSMLASTEAETYNVIQQRNSAVQISTVHGWRLIFYAATH